MPWRPITTADVLNEFTPIEMATLNNIQGSKAALPNILNDTIAEFVGAMNAAGYSVIFNGSAPDQLRRHIIARARWGWLAGFPGQEKLKTDARKKANDDAEKMLDRIAQRQAGALEDPHGTLPSNANWNSENKLLLRTHPVPPPSQQFPPNESGVPPYANPDAPRDN